MKTLRGTILFHSKVLEEGSPRRTRTQRVEKMSGPRREHLRRERHLRQDKHTTLHRRRKYPQPARSSRRGGVALRGEASSFIANDEFEFEIRGRRSIDFSALADVSPSSIRREGDLSALQQQMEHLVLGDV